MNDEDGYRTELDSHANMPVFGWHAYILSDAGHIVDVNAFTPDYDPMQLHIVDASVQYECPYEGTTHILLVRNTVHVPSMKKNLLPPFMVR